MKRCLASCFHSISITGRRLRLGRRAEKRERSHQYVSVCVERRRRREEKKIKRSSSRNVAIMLRLRWERWFKVTASTVLQEALSLFFLLCTYGVVVTTVRPPLLLVINSALNNDYNVAIRCLERKSRRSTWAFLIYFLREAGRLLFYFIF